MYFLKGIIFSELLFITCSIAATVIDYSPKSDITIHVTNKTIVPSAIYTVDAVQALRDAISVYPVEEDQAKAFMDLFQNKHNDDTWIVAVGYSTLICNSSIQIELSVSNEDNYSIRLYRIFNPPPSPQ